MVLINLIQFNKISAPSPDTHNQIAVVFRMLLRIQKLVAVYGIDLHLMPSHVHVALDEHGAFSDRIFRSEHSIVQFNRQRTAVCDTLQVRL